METLLKDLLYYSRVSGMMAMASTLNIAKPRKSLSLFRLGKLKRTAHSFYESCSGCYGPRP